MKRSMLGRPTRRAPALTLQSLEKRVAELERKLTEVSSIAFDTHMKSIDSKKLAAVVERAVNADLRSKRRAH